MNNHFLLIDNNHNLIDSNIIENSSGADLVRFAGHDNWIRRNVFKNGSVKAGVGNHPDFIQTFPDSGGESYNIVFEENFVMNLDGGYQMGQINSGGPAGLSPNFHDYSFKRNVFSGVSNNMNIDVPGVQFTNNTFYRLSYGQLGLIYSGSLFRGDASRGLLASNVFIGGGLFPDNYGSRGFYVNGGGIFSGESLTKGALLDSTTASAIFLNMQTNGYISPNGDIYAKAKALTDISQFVLADQYSQYKSTVYDYLIRSVNLNKSINDTFSANYNFVAGGVSEGFSSKRTFNEQNGINGGDPKFSDINNPLGPDGIPFTLDDGLKPLPSSPLCGKGYGGSDIGAYSCSSGSVLSNGSTPVISMPPPTPTPTPTPDPTPIPTTYTLTVNKSGSGTGTVTGGSINCGSTCTQTGIAGNTAITLVATPQSGGIFTGWSGACTGTGNCNLTIGANTTVGATFGLAPDTTPPTITLNSIPNSTNLSGSVLLGAIASDPVISGQISSGISTVQFMLDNAPLASPLTTPSSGNTYSGSWDTTKTSNGTHTIKAIATDGAGKTTTSSVITVTVNNQAVVIPPVVPTTYTLTLGKSGTGTGTVTGGSINCGSTCTQTGISANTAITLVATPSANNTFTGWSGPCTGTGNCTFTLTSNTTVTANFTAPPSPIITNIPAVYTLTIGKSGTGTGIVKGASIDCGSTCIQNNITSGTSITLVATPLSNSSFVGWSGIGNCSGTGDCTFTLTSNTTINADFTIPPPSLTPTPIFTPTVPQLPVAPTPPNTPKGLSISSLLVSSRTNTGAIISLSTTNTSNARINYGTTNSYGLSALSQSTASTFHTIVLKDLKPNTTYHFNLISKDIYNNTISTGDYTFSTLADSTNKYVTISSVKKPVSTVITPKSNTKIIKSNNDNSNSIIDLSNLGNENATTSTSTPIFTKIKDMKWLQWIKNLVIYTYTRVIDGMIDFGNLLITHKMGDEVYTVKN
jgi:hypothetical protein